MEDSHAKDFIEKFCLKYGFGTRALHSGEHVGQPQNLSHANAIFQTSTFVFEDSSHGADLFAGKRDGYIYTRLGNPTVKVLEAKINALEGCEYKLQNPKATVSTIVFSSGMSAITSTLVALLKEGDKIICGDVVYGATESFCSNILSKFGIKTVEVDLSNIEKFEITMKSNKEAKAVFFETPMNPTLKIADIERISKIAKSYNPDCKVIIDNTFATPYLQKPLNLGADVVVHSTTKYICGHGTVVGGCVTTIDDELKTKIYKVITNMGGSPSPFDSWLVNMGLKTLPLRMERHCDNALEIAKFLEKHPKVEKVYYPGLKDFPAHELAKKQMKKFGGMISFEIKGGYEAGKKLMDNIKLFTLAVSLGCVDSLIQHPASMTHASVPKEKKIKGGITDGLVRVSVGIENVEDLIRELDEGLKKV